MLYMKAKKWLQIFILLAIVVVGGFTLAGSLFDTNAVLKPGSKAPDFTLPEMNGGELTLSDYTDKLVLLNFWGTYCPPCVEEMPLMQRYYDKYKDEGLVVIAVNENESLVRVRGFVRQHELNFPIPMDKDTVRKQYGVVAYPSSFFIKDGIVREMLTGPMDEPYLLSMLNKLMPN